MQTSSTNTPCSALTLGFFNGSSKQKLQSLKQDQHSSYMLWKKYTRTTSAVSNERYKTLSTDPLVIEMEQNWGQDAQWQGKNLAYIMIHY